MNCYICPMQTANMGTEQSMRISREDEKPEDEGATHVSDISNTGEGLERDTEVVQNAGEDAPGVHEHVSSTSFYTLQI